MLSQWRRCVEVSVVAGLATLVFAISVVGPAHAQDLTAKLSKAESRAAAAEVEINDARAQVDPAKARYVAITRRAVPARRVTHLARLRVHELNAELADRQRKAAAQISQIEVRHEQEVDDHDERVKGSLGIGLAAFVVGLITLTWGWFRASAAVAWLTELRFGQAIGLCVFGGLALLIVGAAMAAAGDVVGVIGVLLGVLGFVLPVVLLLARHSAQIQRGRAEPLLRRERLPMWVGITIAAAMGLVVLVGFSTAIFTNGPETVLVSAQLRHRAAPARSSPPNRRLAAAEAEAAELQEEASRLSVKQDAARHSLKAARQQLHRAERRGAAAKHDLQSLRHQLQVIKPPPPPPPPVQSKNCDPNYRGACLDPNSPDYDCAGGSGDGPDYTGPVEVVGVDHFGLDSDGDGFACEG